MQPNDMANGLGKWLAAWAIIALTVLLAPGTSAKTVRLVYEPVENPPRYYGTTAEVPTTRPGATIDIFREVARRLKVDLVLERVPWQRGLAMVESGAADGIFHASYKPDRAAFGVYPYKSDGNTPDTSRAVFFQTYSFYARKDSGLLFDGKTLRGAASRPVAVTRGYSVIRELQALGIPYEEERTQAINLAKLDKGRVAAYAELDNMIAPLLAEHGGSFHAIERLAPPISEKAYYLLFSKKFYVRQPALAEAFWNEIRTVNRSPLLDEILGRYR